MINITMITLNLSSAIVRLKLMVKFKQVLIIFTNVNKYFYTSIDR